MMVVEVVGIWACVKCVCVCVCVCVCMRVLRLVLIQLAALKRMHSIENDFFTDVKNAHPNRASWISTGYQADRHRHKAPI